MLDSAAVFNAEYGLLYSSKLREHAQILWAAIYWRLLSLAQNILKREGITNEEQFFRGE